MAQKIAQFLEDYFAERAWHLSNGKRNVLIKAGESRPYVRTCLPLVELSAAITVADRNSRSGAGVN